MIKNLIWEFIAGLVFLRNDFQEAFNDAKAKSKLSTALKTAAEQRVLKFKKIQLYPSFSFTVHLGIKIMKSF